MNKTFLFISYLIFNTFFSNAQDWKMVWSDEFNYQGKPDSTKWNYEIGYKRNNELQYYTDRNENARVENGQLIIEAIKENYHGYDFTSASLITKNRETWKYGRFEIRA